MHVSPLRYCLACASDAPEIEMMQAARHKSVKNARIYIQDARTVFATAKAEGNTELLSTRPQWKPQYVHDIDDIDIICMPTT